MFAGKFYKVSLITLYLDERIVIDIINHDETNHNNINIRLLINFGKGDIGISVWNNVIKSH